MTIHCGVSHNLPLSPSYQLTIIFECDYGRSAGSATCDSIGTKVAQYLLRDVLPYHPIGFTINPNTASIPSFSKNEYVVSLLGYGVRFKSIPSETVLRKWLINRAEVLQKSQTYVGGWWNKDDGYYYLDISI